MKAEVLIVCAKKAYPGRIWSVFSYAYTSIEFDLSNDMADQMALQIALEDEWKFTRGKHGFEAEKKDGSVILYEQSKPRLLYTIIESEGGGG